MEFDRGHDVHLSHYWHVALKRWKVAAAIIGAVLLGTFIVSYFTKPLYQSRIVLQIERENPNQMTVEDLFMIEPSSQEFLQTQYALLRSHGLAQRVVDDLRLHLDPKFNPGGTSGKATAAELKRIKTNLAYKVQGNVGVTPVKGTSLVEVTFVAETPELAQKIVNGLGDSYIALNTERKFESVRQASQFLTTEIAQLKRDITEGEQNLQRYSESKDIVSLGLQGNVTIQKLDDLTRDLTSAQSERIAREADYNTLASGTATSLPQVTNQHGVGEARAELNRLEREYAQKLSTFRPEHPEMVSLRGQIERQRQAERRIIQEAIGKVREDARTQYMAALAREQSTRDALEAQKREAMKLNANAVMYTTLKTDVESKRSLLEQLTRRLNETEVTARLKGSNSSNIHFVDRAETPGYRSNATLTTNIRKALPLGIVLGLAAIFFLEYMDRSVKTPEEVERITGFASLGIIPSSSAARSGYGYYGKPRSVEARSGEKVDLIPHTNSRSPIAEAYRAFRTSLLLASASSPRVIVITSTLPREGKTTTATNLAVVLAQMGEPVVTVDGDLRKPRLHKVFQRSGQEGLVNFLTGHGSIDSIIKATEVPNLSMIASGPIPPNPSELLASDKMKELIATLRERFSYVIIDSPPVVAVADALVISTCADGVVLCVHGGETSRDLVKRSADRLRQSNISVLGTLLNNVDLDQHSYYHARTYYEYYAEEEEQPESGRARAG